MTLDIEEEKVEVEKVVEPKVETEKICSDYSCKLGFSRIEDLLKIPEVSALMGHF